MPMERRERQNMELTSEPLVGHRTNKQGSQSSDVALSSWVRIGMASRRKEIFNNLFCHFNADNLNHVLKSPLRENRTAGSVRSLPS